MRKRAGIIGIVSAGAAALFLAHARPDGVVSAARAGFRVLAAGVSSAPDAAEGAAGETSPWVPTSAGDQEALEGMERRAIELRRVNGPQAAATYSSLLDDAEEIRRGVLAVWIPTDMLPDLALIFEQDVFRLRGEDGISATLSRLTLRPTWQLDARTDAWLGLTPYGGSTAAGFGSEIGAEYKPQRDWLVQGRAMAFEPWDESSYAVRQDAYLHGFAALLRAPVHEYLTLTVDAAAQWYYLGPEAPGGDGYYAQDLEGGVRADYQVYRGSGKVMGTGFRDRYALADDSLVEGLILYGSLRRRDIALSAADAVVPVTPNSFDIRAGAQYTYVLNAHWGAQVDGYLGADPDRSFAPGEIYGVHGRLVFVPSDRLRFWAGTGMDAESTTSVPGGRTTLMEIGLNVSF